MGGEASRDRLKLEKALEFRPEEDCTANTPHGESPREGDFCRPGGGMGGGARGSVNFRTS